MRTIKSIEVVPVKEPSEPKTWKESVIFEFQRYSRGAIYDIPLKDAEIQGTSFSPQPKLVTHRGQISYYALSASPLRSSTTQFSSFKSCGHILHSSCHLPASYSGMAALFSVIQSISTILVCPNETGDKSNHVATIHLPQLLYISAFIAFFSAPLLIPSIISFLQPVLSVLIPSLRPKSSSTSTSTPTWKTLLTGTFILGSLFAALMIIHFNTLIHPFTLADNRHYVFYVFRYTILFHPLIKYLLAPVYLLCIYLSYRTLSGPSTSSSSSTQSSQPKSTPRKSEVQQRIYDRSQGTKADMDQGPCTSFLLIWVLSTALCLVTAPLVEPRYFILPWIMWRLHVPSLPSPSSSASVSGRQSTPKTRKGGKRRGFPDMVKGYDYRLVIETFWFLAINVVTGYVFLYRGFEWVQEPGNVQRFMW